MNGKLVLTALIALVLGAAGSYWFAKQATEAPEPAGTAVSGPQTERKPLFYRNPMNPAITSPVPAKDEMGMDYIPVYADDLAGTKAPAGTVTIDPVTVQNIGVRTAPVLRKTISRTIIAPGRIDVDEERIVRLHPKVEGWVERLNINKTGQKVMKGEALMSIYSPRLVASQEEYLLALRGIESLGHSSSDEIRHGALDLVASAKKRLELFDVPEKLISRLEQQGEVQKELAVNAPIGGVIMKVGIRAGAYVTPKTELYVIADLSRIWVIADVFEQDLCWVRTGDAASMEVASAPGRIFHGTITYIYPYAAPKTRTIRVRLEFDNPDLILKPDMFAEVVLHGDPKVDALVAPSEAIIRSGTREQVFVVRGPGKFEPREVKVGVESNGLTQIIEGLREGEEVVTSAQFLIDSESKLREAAAKMLEPKAAEHPHDKTPQHDPDGGAISGDRVVPDDNAETESHGNGRQEHAPRQRDGHEGRAS